MSKNYVEEYLQNMLAHLDDMAKKTIFLMGMRRGMQEAQKQDSNINSGSFSEHTEEKMLIEMTGVSINSKPRKDGRIQGYALRDGEKNTSTARLPQKYRKKIQDYLNSAPAPKRKKRNTDTSPLFDVYAAEWVERYKKPNLKPKSILGLNVALKKATDAFAGKTIASITTDDLQEFFNAMPPSRSRDLCAVYVGQLFKKAHALGIIKKNPFEQVELKKHTAEKRCALTIEEQSAFLNGDRIKRYCVYRRKTDRAAAKIQSGEQDCPCAGRYFFRSFLKEKPRECSRSGTTPCGWLFVAFPKRSAFK